jgi:hypothetical protein
VPSKQEYLSAMGIEVWSLRSAEPLAMEPETVSDPLESVRNLAKEPIQPSPQRQKPPESGPEPFEPVPEFRLALFHYDSVGLCVSLEKSAPVPRRFCDDVARLMGGSIDSVRYHQLEWPMLSTSTIDQSIRAAREVVTQKFSILPTRVIVIGAEVAEFFGPLQGAEVVKPIQVGKQSFLLIPSASELFGSAAAKRDLMQTLHQWRQQ